KIVDITMQGFAAPEIPKGGKGKVCTGYFHRFGQRICPVFAPLRSLIHPPGEQLDFVLAKRWRIIRHPFFGIVRSQSPDEFAMFRITGYNRRLSRLSLSKGFLHEEEAQPTILFYSTVARDAVFVDNGFYLGAEIHFF